MLIAYLQSKYALPVLQSITNPDICRTTSPVDLSALLNRRASDPCLDPYDITSPSSSPHSAPSDVVDLDGSVILSEQSTPATIVRTLITDDGKFDVYFAIPQRMDLFNQKTPYACLMGFVDVVVTSPDLVSSVRGPSWSRQKILVKSGVPHRNVYDPFNSHSLDVVMTKDSQSLYHRELLRACVMMDSGIDYLTTICKRACVTTSQGETRDQGYPWNIRELGVMWKCAVCFRSEVNRTCRFCGFKRIPMGISDSVVPHSPVHHETHSHLIVTDPAADDGGDGGDHEVESDDGDDDTPTVHDGDDHKVTHDDEHQGTENVGDN